MAKRKLKPIKKTVIKVKRKRPPYNLQSRLRSAIRRVWLWSPMRRDALARVRIRPGEHECESCAGRFKKLDVDHIVNATPYAGIVKPADWGVFIQRLVYDSVETLEPIKGDKLRCLCKDCHKAKTRQESDARKSFKKKGKII